MRVRSMFKWGLIALVAVVVIVAMGLYRLAGKPPADYRPASLTQDEKETAVKRFARRIQDFGNDAQHNERYVWSLTQDEVNAYLAALDEIVASMPRGRAGRVNSAMARIGLAGPAVSLHDGIVSLMIRSIRHERIVSADLEFRFAQGGLMRVLLRGARIGGLPIPRSMVRNRLDGLKAALLAATTSAPDAQSARGAMGLRPEDLAALAAVILSAMDAQPIAAEITWPVNSKHVRIERIDITEGRMTLHVQPIHRAGRRR